ncbi:4-(cytidine 5'-diphospho)-2-C-methyl-D-erythritol kinase [bacterium]|nr:4-(cytidine 5'-diphospho)-2-C-methyl-D-erythritol kinase [bacterium]
MLRVECPAKINLTLEIVSKRADGFHEIKSVMQTVSLCDILSITLGDEGDTITLSGTSEEIPYDERNLVHKACRLFFDKLGKSFDVQVHIEKHIPVSAGLAGGSTDAAGMLLGLNEALNQPLSKTELLELCEALGSDLNFCLEGGCKLATGRGEILEELPFKKFDLCIVKPKSLGISAKEAYQKYSELKIKPQLNMTEKFISGDCTALHNDLELGLDYPQLKALKEKVPNAVMSGSGSAFFVLGKDLLELGPEYEVFRNLKSVHFGARIIS